MDSPRPARIALQRATPLLGGLSPMQFMRRHWQRRPLLVRGAFGPGDGHGAPLDRRALFALAAEDDVASRLIVLGVGVGVGVGASASASPGRTAAGSGSGTGTGNRSGQAGTVPAGPAAAMVDVQAADAWHLRHGPFPRRALPALSQPGWTLLVQGVDRHVPAARALLDRFRFVPDARLDDVMVSYASDGGGVGPHLDSYDVFLVQVQGHRRWRVAPATRAADRAFVPGLPLRILARFEAHDDWVLAPGDMLYLPPGWAHEGTAVGGDCMTCSIGFRAPDAVTAGRETLARLLDADGVGNSEASRATGQRRRRAPPTYRDPTQTATANPAAIPPALAAFIRDAARRLASDPPALDRAIGTWLSEPHDDVWFDNDTAGTDIPSDAGCGSNRRSGRTMAPPAGAMLDHRTRLLYDARHLYINGTAVAMPPRDAASLRRLADDRTLDAAAVRRCGPAARALLAGWAAAGWLQLQR